MARTKSPDSVEPFLWGAATSSHQIEGNNRNNDWWAWETAGNVEGGVSSGAATDHLNRFREDMKLAADLGLNSYRFSVEWSRLEPERGRWNAEAMEWYRELIAECEKNGLVPMLTLHHFTSPQWFAEGGGFVRPESPGIFATYVKKVVESLGSRVPLWCTLNEPVVLTVGGYIAKFMPPAVSSPRDAARVTGNLLQAHVLAYDLIHGEVETREGPSASLPLRVGLAHNMVDFLPDRNWHPLERFLAGMFHRFYNRAWLDAVTGGPQRFGVPGLLPAAATVKAAQGRRTVDFIGVNYYTKAYVRWRPRDASEGELKDLPLGIAFARRKEIQSDLSWAIHAEGFGKMLRFAGRYGLPVYVTENGIADREDRLRPEFLRVHLREIARAREAGIDIRGYYHWSLLDNFEWIKGFWPRFGLYRVNYQTFERSPTRSANLYRDWIRRCGSKGPTSSVMDRILPADR